MHRAYLDWIAFLFIALRIVSGQMLFNSSGKSSECSINSLYSWQCDNGECIPMEELCDGIMNCADKSDESVEQCLHKPCPAYAFKCAYGGCITGTYQCNGIIDCVDGSDETRFLCDKSLNYGQTLRGSCWLSSQMQCKSGECLSGDRACDGIQDCNDGSDETVELCSFLKCPEYAFRCGYGACVSGKARCNGRFDCIDGSDESPGLCGNTNRPQPNITTTVRPPYRPPATRTTTQAPVSTTLRPSYAPSTTRATTASPPSEKPTFSGKFCSPNTLMRGISTVASCSLNNNPVSCAHSLRIGTTAKISCAPGYMKYRKHPKETTTVFCDQDGEWSQSKFKCFPRCGELTEEQTKSITKPWDVTITRRSYMPLYLAICSGVIVSPKIVITAANCLESIEEGYATDHVAYNVIEGYYNSSYKEGDVLSAVVHNISAINIKTSPRSDDLAVLVLVNYFRFSDLLKPVCLPSIHNKLSLVGDMILNIGRGVTRDTSREYLEFLIARLGTVDSGRRTTNIEYIRISTFVPFIMREIKRYRHIL